MTSTRERALATLARMRREGIPLSKAARIEGISPRIVREYVRPALRRGRGGEYWAVPHDRIRRTLNFLDSRGLFPITVFESDKASEIAQFMNAVQWYRNTGDPRRLRPFKGKVLVVNGRAYRFITDLETLDRLADAGALRLDHLYR
jgi:hypothetical protein